MGQTGYAMFETAVGVCGIAWNERGIGRIQLPEADPAAAEARLARESQTVAAEPPAPVRDAIERIRRHLAGELQDLADLPLDLAECTDFERTVLQLTREIPAGTTRTYGQIAAALGRPGAARAVGGALARNPVPLAVPCHRVLAAGGRLGGFSAHGAGEAKRRLLAIEGVAVGEHAAPASLWERGALAAAVEHLQAADERLARVIAAVGPCRLKPECPGNPFAALAESIVYQQLAGRVASVMVDRLAQRFGGGEFPGPAAVLAAGTDGLRAAGLSGGKAASLLDLAARAGDGRLDLAALPGLDEVEVRTRLIAVRGIGPWTAEMFLIFHLGRPDVWPTGDLGIRKAVQRLAGWRALPEPPRMIRLARPWRPFRTVAAWYLWRSLGVVTLG